MDFRKMRVRQLRMLAKKAGIRRPSSMNKSKLIAALSGSSVPRKLSKPKRRYAFEKISGNTLLRPDFKKALFGDPNFPNYPNFVRYQLRMDPDHRDKYKEMATNAGIYDLSAYPIKMGHPSLANTIKMKEE